MKTKIENIEDLHLEIVRLEFQCAQQEAVLVCHIKSTINKFRVPNMLLNKLQSWFGGGAGEKNKEEHDWVNNTLHAVLPIALDKLFFRKSSFVVKTLVALIAQNTASFITKDTITEIVKHVTEWIKNTKAKQAEKRDLDFGIPPDSETY